MTAPVAVVVPTVGRPSLRRTLAPLAGRLPVVVVDDRRGAPALLDIPAGVRVVRSGGRGPAAARNAGWRSCDARWVAFLDDDVVPPPGWPDALTRDLADLPDDVAGSQGRLVVPLPATRPATDWERSTAGLADAVWATADLAYRRDALTAVGGFDEAFPRAYREDADLGVRLTRAGWRIVRGERWVEHPVRPAPWWVSVRMQRGNADDARMRARHGAGWRTAAHVPAGRRPWHLATTGALAVAALAAVARRPVTAGFGAAAWLALTADFAARRIAPGPRDAREVAAMAVTSAAIPPAASAWWLRGWLDVLRERRAA